MDRDYWNEMEAGAEGSLRIAFWDEVRALHMEAVKEAAGPKMKEAYSIKLRDLIGKHERLRKITFEALARAANGDDDD